MAPAQGKNSLSLHVASLRDASEVQLTPGKTGRKEHQTQAGFWTVGNPTAQGDEGAEFLLPGA